MKQLYSTLRFQSGANCLANQKHCYDSIPVPHPQQKNGRCDDLRFPVSELDLGSYVRHTNHVITLFNVSISSLFAPPGHLAGCLSVDVLKSRFSACSPWDRLCTMENASLGGCLWHAVNVFFWRNHQTIGFFFLLPPTGHRLPSLVSSFCFSFFLCFFFLFLFGHFLVAWK